MVKNFKRIVNSSFGHFLTKFTNSSTTHSSFTAKKSALGTTYVVNVKKANYLNKKKKCITLDTKTTSFLHKLRLNTIYGFIYGFTSFVSIKGLSFKFFLKKRPSYVFIKTDKTNLEKLKLNLKLGFINLNTQKKTSLSLFSYQNWWLSKTTKQLLAVKKPEVYTGKGIYTKRLIFTKKRGKKPFR